MYAGEIIEEAEVVELFAHPLPPIHTRFIGIHTCAGKKNRTA
jgi:ABC-type dipeptide/oligopeptide/nickel transport system ATPase component